MNPRRIEQGIQSHPAQHDPQRSPWGIQRVSLVFEGHPHQGRHQRHRTGEQIDRRRCNHLRRLAKNSQPGQEQRKPYGAKHPQHQRHAHPIPQRRLRRPVVPCSPGPRGLHRHTAQQPHAKNQWHHQQGIGKSRCRQRHGAHPPYHHCVHHPDQHLRQLPEYQRHRQPQGGPTFLPKGRTMFQRTGRTLLHLNNSRPPDGPPLAAVPCRAQHHFPATGPPRRFGPSSIKLLTDEAG